MSQDRLADRLGISFQQVQKYERGTNRISASKLFEAAEVLEVNIGEFYEGYRGAAEGGPRPDIISPDVIMIAQILQDVPEERRRQLIEVVKVLAA